MRTLHAHIKHNCAAGVWGGVEMGREGGVEGVGRRGFQRWRRYMGHEGCQREQNRRCAARITENRRLKNKNKNRHQTYSVFWGL